MPASASMASSRAFTLTELLVVIAIVGILTAIIIPTVGRIHEAAQNTTCQSNLRQVFNLYMLDVQDNRGRLPAYHYTDADGKSHTSVWANGIATKYYGAEARGITQVLGCPVQIELKGQPLLDNSVKNHRAPMTYAINNRDLLCSVDAPYTETTKTLASIPFPARVALAGDGNDSDHAPDYYNGVIGIGRPPQACHNGKANICFLDGHVESIGDQSLLNVPAPPKAGTPQAMFWFGE